MRRIAAPVPPTSKNLDTSRSARRAARTFAAHAVEESPRLTGTQNVFVPLGRTAAVRTISASPPVRITPSAVAVSTWATVFSFASVVLVEIAVAPTPTAVSFSKLIFSVSSFSA